MSKVKSFLDIPYASSNGRFKAASPAGPWTGASKTDYGPVFPQAKGRLAFVMGTTKEEANWSEDAFRLNVWAPEEADSSSKLPVVFFIHGGAWMTGGGAIPWYSGENLVARGLEQGTPFLFVNFNYRLGFLGNAWIKGITDKNCSYKDVLLALQWVRTNISQFGGDPDKIHIAGQSAGAWFAVAMMSDSKWNSQFRSSSLFSFPGGAKPLLPKEVRPMMNAVKNAAGVRSFADFTELPVEKIVEAQGAAAKKAARIGCVYMPMVEKDVIPKDILSAAAQNAPADCKVFASTNAQETTPFVAKKYKALNLVPTPFLRVPAKMFFGSNSEKMYRYYTRKLAPEGSYNRIVAMSTDSVFSNPTDELLSLLQGSGHVVKRTTFTTESPQEHVGCCHCFDMPFLFGTFDAFANAPFLQGMDRAECEAISRTMQEDWLSFILG